MRHPPFAGRREWAREITIAMWRLLALLISIVLPSGWVLQPAPPLFVRTGTMPQGAAASPDGTVIAVVESGFNPPALRLYDPQTLALVATIPLAGAFGRPLWLDSRYVLVAGANAEALFKIDTAERTARKIAFPAHTFPVGVARSGDRIAVATDDDGAVRIGTLANVAAATPVHVGTHPGPMAFSADGRTLYAADRAAASVKAIDVATLAMKTLPTGLHPSDLLIVGDRLYVAQSDDDSVGIYTLPNQSLVGSVFVGDSANGRRLAGASPNALAWADGSLYVSLGAANTVAVVSNGRVAGRIAAGRYPTDVVPLHGRLYVIDGKGEAVPANPRFNVYGKSNTDYVAAIEYGSIRGYSLSDGAGSGSPQGAVGWQASAPTGSIVRAGGPIRHVFFILKENRTYDQILGDERIGNGDAKLALFGRAVTPNQHLLAERFGLFDEAYASGEVSDPGHNWADGAFANDYVERVWPPTYGQRADGDDNAIGAGAGTAHGGYIWDAAARAHVSFRDYGEMVNEGGRFDSSPKGTPASLGNRYDPKYVGWNLDYSDLDRYREWDREFQAFVRRGDLPALEYIWLPNDHTYGSKPGKPTPAAYIAQNDYALGLIVQAISHSPVWKSSAIFITEDDAQDGADHVSAQRTTFFVVSPYAKGGVAHGHYTTTSMLRTMELLLGIEPLSTYDAMASPLYARFASTPNLRSYAAVKPRVTLAARNLENAYGSKISANLDFSRPDATPPGLLREIIAHNAATSP